MSPILKNIVVINAYAERWVRSVKEECLSKIIPFGERSLRRALNEYVAHYHAERNHQGKSDVLLFRRVTQTRLEEPVRCRERLGGLLARLRGFALENVDFEIF